jgi:hypothetical protein
LPRSTGADLCAIRGIGVAASAGKARRCIMATGVSCVALSLPVERRMVMRSCRMWTLALAAVIAWAPTRAAADEKPKPVPEEGSLQVVLLRHKSVRDDLKRVEELPDAKERDRKYDEMTKENEQFLDEVLTAAQRKRLHQITLQVAGLLWITRPDVAAELKLTDEQKKKAVEYQQEARKEMEELLHSTTRRDRHAELRKLHEASKKRLLELLTDDQETKYHEMLGHPFRGELRFDEPALIEEKSEK